MNEKNTEKGLDIVNKTIDLVNKVYDDGLSKPVKVIGNGLSICLSFLGATVSPMMYEYIKNAEYKKEEINKKLERKYNLIPEEKRTEPRMKIMGPAVDILKYNLDEDHIKEIFINIMCSEMNAEKQEKVLPSYIEIVKQLSKKDAETLKCLYELYKDKNKTQFALDIIRAKPKNVEDGYIEIEKQIIGNASQEGTLSSVHTINLEDIVLDNLSRLELIKVYDDKYLPDLEESYEIGFNSIKSKYSFEKDFEIYFEKGVFEITAYGLNFLNICFG